MRISDWSSDVCSSDLTRATTPIFPSLSRRHRSRRSSWRMNISKSGFQLPRECWRRRALAMHKDGSKMRPFLLTKPLNGSTTRSEEHTSELQSLMRISYAVFCLKNTTHNYKSQE